jgi:hypothetical protein
MAKTSIRAMYDTRYFDGVSRLLVTADSRKTNLRTNKTPHSHTKNQTRKATEVQGSKNIGDV